MRLQNRLQWVAQSCTTGCLIHFHAPGLIWVDGRKPAHIIQWNRNLGHEQRVVESAPGH